MKTSTEWIAEYLEDLEQRVPSFTGQIELNFKYGMLMDIKETHRTRFEDRVK